MDKQLMLRLLRECSTHQWNKYRENHPEWVPDLRGLKLDSEGFARGLNDPFIPENFNLRGALYDHTTTFYYGFNPEKYGLVFREAGQDEQEPAATSETRTGGIDVFISHSSRDKKLAEAVVELLRSALNLSHQQIRCSNVAGYRLPAGAPVEERLRSEVHQAKVLFGLITRSSVYSAYVLFELGARWGAAKPMFPLLAGGPHHKILVGPLQAINAIDCSDSGQLHQLIDEIAMLLEVRRENPAVYQKHIERVVCLASSGRMKSRGALR